MTSMASKPLLLAVLMLLVLKPVLTIAQNIPHASYVVDQPQTASYSDFPYQGTFYLGQGQDLLGVPTYPNMGLFEGLPSSLPPLEIDTPPPMGYGGVSMVRSSDYPELHHHPLSNAPLRSQVPGHPSALPQFQLRAIVNGQGGVGMVHSSNHPQQHHHPLNTLPSTTNFVSGLGVPPSSSVDINQLHPVGHGGVPMVHSSLVPHLHNAPVNQPPASHATQHETSSFTDDLISQWVNTALEQLLEEAAAPVGRARSDSLIVHVEEPASTAAVMDLDLLNLLLIASEIEEHDGPMGTHRVDISYYTDHSSDDGHDGGSYYRYQNYDGQRGYRLDRYAFGCSFCTPSKKRDDEEYDADDESEKLEDTPRRRTRRTRRSRRRITICGRCRALVWEQIVQILGLVSKTQVPAGSRAERPTPRRRNALEYPGIDESTRSEALLVGERDGEEDSISMSMVRESDGDVFSAAFAEVVREVSLAVEEECAIEDILEETLVLPGTGTLEVMEAVFSLEAAVAEDQEEEELLQPEDGREQQLTEEIVLAVLVAHIMEHATTSTAVEDENCTPSTGNPVVSLPGRGGSSPESSQNSSGGERLATPPQSQNGSQTTVNQESAAVAVEVIETTESTQEEEEEAQTRVALELYEEEQPQKYKNPKKDDDPDDENGGSGIGGCGFAAGSSIGGGVDAPSTMVQ